MAEEEGRRGIEAELTSVVGSGRGSLSGRSGKVTLRGGSIESGNGGGRRLMGVRGRSGEFIVRGGSMGRKHRR